MWNFLFTKAFFGALILLTGLFPTAFADEVVADPHRFDDAITAFEAADKISMPEPGKVLLG